MNFKIATAMLVFSQPFAFGSYSTKYGVRVFVDGAPQRTYFFCNIEATHNERLSSEQSFVRRVAIPLSLKGLFEYRLSACVIDTCLTELWLKNIQQATDIMDEFSRTEESTYSSEPKQRLKDVDEHFLAFLSDYRPVADNLVLRYCIAVIKEHLLRRLQCISDTDGDVFSQAFEQMEQAQEVAIDADRDANVVWANDIQSVFNTLES
ncbi:MAG: hypothetical protein LBR89_05000, partial [Holosporales bacterium]|nr:hypothetical protein [Holosporales bacterium]